MGRVETGRVGVNEHFRLADRTTHFGVYGKPESGRTKRDVKKKVCQNSGGGKGV